MSYNPITKALVDIRHRIPRRILEEAFIKRNRLFSKTQTPVNVEHRIRQTVIEGRVMVDCNLNGGGTELTIKVGDLPIRYSPEGFLIIHVPLERTRGRRILSYLSVSLTEQQIFPHSGPTGGLGGSVNTAVNDLINMNSAPPVVSNAYIHDIGENTFMLEMSYPPTRNMHVVVRVENDAQMNNLSPVSYKYFSKLVEYATKAYIFNHLVLEIDEGYLSGGRELGRFREIVDNYADAEELYQEVLDTTWPKVALMNDPTRKMDHLRSISQGLSKA